MQEKSLSSIAERYWQLRMEETPLFAILSDATCSTPYLWRESPEDHRRRAEAAATMMSELKSVDSEELNATDRHTLTLLERELALLVDAFEVGAHWRQTLYPLGPDFLLSYWAQGVSLQTEADAKLYLQRIQSVRQGIEGIRESLREGHARGVRWPRLIIERAIEQVRSGIATTASEHTLFEPVKTLVEQKEHLQPLADRVLDTISNDIFPAFESFAAFIENELGSDARDTLNCTDSPQGMDFYRQQIRFQTSLDLDPDEIHRLGLDEVQRVSSRMDHVAAQAGFEGNLAGYIDYLRNDSEQFAKSADELRETIEVLSKRIDLLIPTYFGTTPRTTYGVKTMAERTSAKSPPALAQPNPADNSSPGIHWITAHPEKCPAYMHIPLALHEAWPGHLMHIALIQEMNDLPAFRRCAYNYAMCLEGWALYCEALGEEMGLYDTPEKLYGRLEMEMWRAVRLVVDTGVHVKNWTRDEAIAFFEQHMALPRLTIEAEVDRYIAWPAQALAYQIGNLKFRELRQRSEAALGDRFSVRDFHDTLMSAGAVTLPVLEQVVDEWLSAANHEIEAA